MYLVYKGMLDPITLKFLYVKWDWYCDCVDKKRASKNNETNSKVKRPL